MSWEEASVKEPFLIQALHVGIRMRVQIYTCAFSAPTCANEEEKTRGGGG